MENKKSVITRRNFIKLQVKSGLFLAFTTSSLFLPKFSFASATPDIGVAKGNAMAATKAAVDLIGGIKNVVKKR